MKPTTSQHFIHHHGAPPTVDHDQDPSPCIFTTSAEDVPSSARAPYILIPRQKSLSRKINIHELPTALLTQNQHNPTILLDDRVKDDKQRISTAKPRRPKISRRADDSDEIPFPTTITRRRPSLRRTFSDNPPTTRTRLRNWRRDLADLGHVMDGIGKGGGR